ncbi:MAG TPA: transposase [Anaerolineaceae bacterium]|nr:transposase [Anaerolineaceae bacterium]
MSEKILHHRRSIRLADNDYSAEGGYYITIVTQGRVCLFGEPLSQKTLGGAKTAIVGGEVCINEFGKIVWDEWFKTAQLRQNVELMEDEFVVMPNHIHGIIWLNDGGVNRMPTKSTMNNRSSVGAYSHTPLRSPSHTIGAIVRGFKGAVTTRINTQRDQKGVAVWQRNYYEHIISSERDYENIANYIYTNPINWDADGENIRS